MLASWATGCGDTADSSDPDVTITSVTLLQGVETPIMSRMRSSIPAVPVIEGRDALLRVSYEAPVDTEVTGTLRFSDGTSLEPVSSIPTLPEDGIDRSRTVNFHIDGSRIADALDYAITLRPGTARWPITGFDSVPVEGPRSTLRVVLVPFAYDADGSGRLPDLSREQVEKYRSHWLGTYPVSHVEVSVREAEHWSERILANGEGWQDLGFRLFMLRQADQAPDDVYYYGVFDPAASLDEYCSAACQVGLTVLNDDPSETGMVDLRLAMGVGFTEIAADTAVHELGHAHGLRHAPCGPGLDPNSIDSGYPYDGRSIGVWGYDVVSRVLFSPHEHSDIMGYCQPQWISDYNFIKLFERGQSVNAARIVARDPPGANEYELIGVDGKRNPILAGPVTVRAPVRGRRVAVRLSGEFTEATVGHWFSYDHLPGGWVLVPKPSWRATHAEVLFGDTSHLRNSWASPLSNAK